MQKQKSSAINNYMANDEEDKNSDKKPRKRKSSNVTPDQFHQLLKDALSSYADIKTRKTADLCESVSATLEEFLQTFIVIGYDMQGNPINIVNAYSQQDADALSTAVTRFFYQRNQDMGF